MFRGTVLPIPASTGAMAKYLYADWIPETFTQESRYGQVLQMYRRDGDYAHVPRGVCPVGRTDARVVGRPIEITGKVVPRGAVQAGLINQMNRELDAGRSFIFEASTGFGKTVCAIDCIARVGRKTLIVVPKTDLRDVWCEELVRFTSLKPEDIGVIQQDRCEVDGKKVVVGMLHSLALPDRYPESIKDEFGFIVFDEVHRLGADTFSAVAGMFPAKLRLGLSATPHRADGKEVIFTSHIGPVGVTSPALLVTPKVRVVESGWRCPEWMKTAEIGRTMHVVTRMAKDRARNAVIAKVVAAAYRKKRTVVVFSELLGHLNALHDFIVGAGVPMEEIGLYVGGKSQSALALAGSKKVILATYKMMGEGTNLPWLDACVLTTPRADVRQIVGRILREYPDKRTPVVFDIRDRSCGAFAAYARKRAKWYREVGAEVVQISV